jgi:hypothetical protein
MHEWSAAQQASDHAMHNISLSCTGGDSRLEGGQGCRVYASAGGASEIRGDPRTVRVLTKPRVFACVWQDRPHAGCPPAGEHGETAGRDELGTNNRAPHPKHAGAPRPSVGFDHRVPQSDAEDPCRSIDDPWLHARLVLLLLLAAGTHCEGIRSKGTLRRRDHPSSPPL